MEEFSAYDDLAEKVKQLVNDDIGAKEFFESLSTPKFKVKYGSFGDAMGFIQGADDTKVMVFAMPIKNKLTGFKSMHSIFIYKGKGAPTWYDPNGAYGTGANERYLVNGKAFETSAKFFLWWNIPELAHKQGKGAQAFINMPNEGYIHDNGYCMFLNYLAIEYLKEEKNSRKIDDYLKSIRNLNERTKRIARKVFGSTQLRF